MACLALLTLKAKAAELGGEIGLDLNIITFESNLKDTTRSYSIDRSRSSHFLQMNAAGALVNSHFANYSARMRLFGVYFNSSIDSLSNSEYLKPDLRTFYGQATFLPDRPFPLKIYRGTTRDYTLRYEANNRSDYNRLQPPLSIVRRYQSNRTSTGAAWQLTPSNKVDLLMEVKEELSDISRVYNFGENLDIWVSVTGNLARPGDSVFTVIFRNELPDTVSIVITNLDSINTNPTFPVIRIDDLPPGFNITVDSVYIGLNEIQIGSEGFNSYVNAFDVQENLTVSITYRDPATPNDIDQKQRSFTSVLKLADIGKLKSEAFYEYTDQGEAIQRQSTFLHNFANTAGYEFNRELNASLFTSYAHNKTITDTVSTQVNQAFTHQSTLGYARRGGLSASLNHTINRNISEVSGDTLRSTMNAISQRLSIPVAQWNYRFDLRNSVSLLSDNAGYVNNQYSTEIMNNLDYSIMGIAIQPRQQLKYTFNHQQNPDKESQEIEVKGGLVSEGIVPAVGEFRVRGEYTYRNRWDDRSSDIKNRYIVDFSLIKKFSKSYRLSLLSTQEWEQFGGESKIANISIPSRIEHKASYKIDLKTSPFKDLSISGNFMLITQETTSIKKFGLSLITVIPKINLPIKSFAIAEIRDLEGIDKQTQLNLETRTNYQIRKISITFKHILRRENQIFEKYTVNEFMGQLSRQFDL